MSKKQVLSAYKRDLSRILEERRFVKWKWKLHLGENGAVDISVQRLPLSVESIPLEHENISVLFNADGFVKS